MKGVCESGGGIWVFGLGIPELLLILVIALILVGPKRLPEVGASLGKAMGELRRSFNAAAGGESNKDGAKPPEGGDG